MNLETILSICLGIGLASASGFRVFLPVFALSLASHFNVIPLNEAESQGSFFINLPDLASSVDNIQIQRGVGTSTNGAGAFGASLNIQTTTRRDSAYAELNNTYGSFETWKNTVNVGTGLINNKFSFDGRLSRIKSDGYLLILIYD